jgi:hypothetical protein
MLLLLGCSRENNETKLYNTPPATNSAMQSPLPILERAPILPINQVYWITASPTGDGRFGYFIGASDSPADVVNNSFVAGTNVLLLEVSNQYCKVEGLEATGNHIVKGWIFCERLVNFEPTPVPSGLYIHSP